MKKIITTAALLGALSLGATAASAQYNYVAEINTAFGSTLNAADGSACLACHASVNNATNKDKGVTPFATQWKALASTDATGKLLNTLTTTDQNTLAIGDADNDNTDNATEAKAGTNFWGAVATTPPPASGDSGGGCIASSATTPLMMVLAMLSLGFFVRRKKS